MLQVKVLRSLVVVIAVVARGRDLCTDRDFLSGCYRRILLQRVAVVAVVPVTFFRDVRRLVHEQWDMRLE